MDDKNKKSNETTDIQETFIDKIIEVFTGLKSEDRIRSRKLKEIGKELQQSKKKFYNYKKDTVLPAFSEAIYEIFRNSQSIARYFDVKTHSKSIKEFLFDSFVTNKEREVKDKLSKEKLKVFIISSADPNKSIQEVKDTLKQFVHSFDTKMVNKINETYNQIVNLSYLISYDWYFVIHKFDSNITEVNFDYKPSFEVLDGKYIADDITAINDYLTSINFNEDFDNVLTYLHQISSDNSLSDILKKIIHQLRTIKRDEYLTKMIKVITKDPYFKPKNFASKEKIVQDYIMTFQTEVRETIEECIRDINKNKVNKLLLEVFNTTIIVRMKNYSARINEFLLSKGIGGGLKYVEPLNYIKAFMLDICKGEIKPRIDLLIIKGTWESNGLTSKYTQLLDNINKMSARVIEFDEKCSDEGTLGKDLKKYSGVLKHDKNEQTAVRRTIVSVDGEAQSIIIECINMTVDLGKSIKLLIEDYNTKIPKLIINFHKIKWDFTGEFNADMITIYKKLSNMVALLKRYVIEKPLMPVEPKKED